METALARAASRRSVMLTRTVGMSDFAISSITASVPGREMMKPSKPSPFSFTMSLMTPWIYWR